MILSEIAQYPEVGTVHLCDEHEGKVFVAAFFYLSRTEDATAAGIDKDGYQSLWVVSVLTLMAVLAFQGGCIKRLEQILVEITFVSLWQKVKYVAREQ